MGDRMTTEQDLFGQPIKEPVKYSAGYFARPGSGPEGQTCGTCIHANGTGRAGKYKKCARMKRIWSHGAGTDIKLKSPACEGWEAKP